MNQKEQIINELQNAGFVNAEFIGLDLTVVQKSISGTGHKSEVCLYIEEINRELKGTIFGTRNDDQYFCIDPIIATKEFIAVASLLKDMDGC